MSWSKVVLSQQPKRMNFHCLGAALSESETTNFTPARNSRIVNMSNTCTCRHTHVSAAITLSTLKLRHSDAPSVPNPSRSRSRSRANTCSQLSNCRILTNSFGLDLACTKLSLPLHLSLNYSDRADLLSLAALCGPSADRHFKISNPTLKCPI